ncbi:FtsX-like permease family protein [Chloroflexota bacterium]
MLPTTTCRLDSLAQVQGGGRDIWTQFLMEAGFLAMTGGIIGVVAGWVVSYFISSMGQMTTVVSTDIVP